MGVKKSIDIDPIIIESIEQFICPVMILDDDCAILYANASTGDLFGDLVGLDLKEIFPLELNDDGKIFGASEGTSEIWFSGVAYNVKWSSITINGNKYQITVFDDISESAGARENLRDRISKIKQETEIAKQIQSSILPADGEYDQAVRINSAYMPAGDLGGDVFGIVKAGPGKTLFYIADVSGHGIQTSLLTVFLRESIRSAGRLAGNGLPVLIDEVMKEYIALDIDPSIYATALFCCYDRPNNELAIANAGHNCMPFIIRGGGDVDEITARGLPISKLSGMVGQGYEETKIKVKAGDRVLLYTDGIVEEYSKIKRSSLGSDGLMKIATEWRGLEGKEFADKIIEESSKYAAWQASDDRAILVVDIIA